MSDTHDNIINASARFSTQDRKDEELDRQRRDGQRLLHQRNRQKLSTEDRETVARNIGYLLNRHRIERRALAHTADCITSNITAKELHDLVLRPGEHAVAHRLRADVSKYRAVIRGLGALTGMDAPLLANTVFSGTSIHPSSGPTNSEIEDLIQLLYDLTEAVDNRYDLSARFSTLAQRRNLCPPTADFASWPSGTSPASSSVFEAVSPFWWDGIVKDYFRGGTIIDNASLRGFLRYMPHFFLGIGNDFDDNWPIPEGVSTTGASGITVFRDGLRDHPMRDALKHSNRNRLAETVGDVAKQQRTWNRTGDAVLINGLSEEDYQELGREHMRGYLKEVGLQENWQRDTGEIVSEHGIWICLYPSWKSTVDRVSNLVPVIVQNYGMGGANGELQIDAIDIWLSQIASTRLVTGLTVLERLEEALSAENDADEPELKSELCRTALFIEHHPLLQHYRKLEAGARNIRAFREQALRSNETRSD